jgi:phage shock protein A
MGQRAHIAAINARKTAGPDASESSASELEPTVEALLESALDNTQDQLQAAQQKVADLQNTARVERRKLQRTVASKQKLQEQIKFLKSADFSSDGKNAKQAIHLLQCATAESTHLKSQLSQLLDKCALEAQNSKFKQSELQAKLSDTRAKLKTFKKHCD